MKTVVEVIQLASSYLSERKVDRSRRMAEDLLSHLLQLKRIELYMQHDRPVEEKELVILRDLLKRAAKGEPTEYLTGEVDFYGCKLKIDRRVLIPRPETEILADLVSKRVRGSVLWDVCTGSGALAIALKKKHPALAVAASDIAEDALALAAENARKNDVEVEFLKGDLLRPFAGRMADVIVCNPPYISDKEFLELDPSVRDFEPKGALVGGERGTELYVRLAAEIGAGLKPGGLLALEIGHAQGEAVREIFNGCGEVAKDWSGKDRFFFLEKQ